MTPAHPVRPAAVTTTASSSRTAPRDAATPPRTKGRSRAPRAARWPSWWARDDGRVTAFVVVLTTALLAVAGLTLDGGRALAAKVEALGRAESAARAGADAIDLATYRATGRIVLVPDRAATAARAYLAVLGADGQVVVEGDQVTVTVTATTPTQLLGLVGVRDLTVHATGTAHPRHGVTTPDP